MKASSRPTAKGPFGSEKLQLGGISPRMVVRQNCTKVAKFDSCRFAVKFIRF